MNTTKGGTMQKDVDKHGVREAVDAIRVAFPQANTKAINEAFRVLRKSNRANGGA